VLTDAVDVAAAIAVMAVTKSVHRRVTDSHSAVVGCEYSRKKRSISLAASGPRGSV
jgi:hypothetical protein